SSRAIAMFIGRTCGAATAFARPAARFLNACSTASRRRCWLISYAIRSSRRTTSPNFAKSSISRRLDHEFATGNAQSDLRNRRFWPRIGRICHVLGLLACSHCAGDQSGVPALADGRAEELAVGAGARAIDVANRAAEF